jgi:hypothetical protein
LCWGYFSLFDEVDSWEVDVIGVVWATTSCVGVVWAIISCVGVVWTTISWVGVVWVVTSCVGVGWASASCVGVVWTTIFWVGVVWAIISCLKSSCAVSAGVWGFSMTSVAAPSCIYGWGTAATSGAGSCFLFE